MKISFAVAMLIGSSASLKLNQRINNQGLSRNNEQVKNERMEAWEMVQHNVNDVEYMSSQENALNEQVVGQNLHMKDSGSKPANADEKIADILSKDQNLDKQDASIKSLFGIKDPVVKHDFVEENQNIIATAQNYHGEPSDKDLGLDDSHKSHLLVFDPTLGDLPTNVESANVIANAMAAPHDKKTQDKLITSHHDEVASGAQVKDPAIPVPQVHVTDIESTPEPVAVDANPPMEENENVAMKHLKPVQQSQHQTLAQSLEKSAEQAATAQQAQQVIDQNNAQFAIMQNQHAQHIQNMVDNMSGEMDMFSKTLDMSHYDKAMSLAQTLKKEGLKDHDKILSVHTKDAFKEGFKQFPQIAQNEYVQEQLAHLEGAEDNLNGNISNPRLVQKYIDAGKEVAQNLSQQFGENWQNPLAN